MLLLRLSAPLQAWGTQSHFTNRDTGREPSKSGVIGLLCAALGRGRSASLDDLAPLHMGVRVDQEGVVRRDFHTAGMGRTNNEVNVYTVGGSMKHDLVVSDRFYLADARFLVGLEGEADLLAALHEALQRPKWFLFLGRKSCVPAERVWLPDGLQDMRLIDALTTYPWLPDLAFTPDPRRRTASMRPAQLRLVIEDSEGVAAPDATVQQAVRADQPISFSPRRFLPRRTRTIFVPTPHRQEN